MQLGPLEPDDDDDDDEAKVPINPLPEYLPTVSSWAPGPGW
jgi:hypothetical protein